MTGLFRIFGISQLWFYVAATLPGVTSQFLNISTGSGSGRASVQHPIARDEGPQTYLLETR